MDDADEPIPGSTPRTTHGPDGLDAVSGLARIAVSAWWRTTGWAVQSSLHAARRLAEAAFSPEKALGIARDVRVVTQDVLRGVINATEVGRSVSSSAQPAADAAMRIVSDVVPSSRRSDQAGPGADGHSRNGSTPERSLRDEGESLLRKSRDVRYEFDAHPAYERILSELAPDEGRVLRLLLLDGPQPAVDVRTGGPLGLLKSRLIAPGISMTGARAGCRYVDRVPPT